MTMANHPPPTADNLAAPAGTVTPEAYWRKRVADDQLDFLSRAASRDLFLTTVGGDWSTDTGLTDGTPILVLPPEEFDPDTEEFCAICTVIPFPPARQGFKAAYRLGRLLNQCRGAGWLEEFVDELFPSDQGIVDGILWGADHPLPSQEAA